MKTSILFFADRLPPLIGGMEMHAQFFLQHFLDHPKFFICGIVTKNTNQEDCVLMHGKKYPIQLQELKSYSPNIVFFNSGYWVEKFDKIRNLFLKIPFFYRTGGNEILKAPLSAQLNLRDHRQRQAYWTAAINRNIDCLITNSEYTETRLSILGTNCNFFRSIGGVNNQAIQFFQKKRNEVLTIFCAARFVPYKNHALLISVIHHLISKGYNLQLRLAGDGPLLSKTKKLVAQLKLDQYVQFLGVINNLMVCQEIAQADVYMQLSSNRLTKVLGGSYIHSEGMGRAILEAITLGTFVVAGESGALSEIITPDRGVIVNFDNFQQAFNVIEQKIFHLPLQKKMTDEYLWKKVFQKYEELFCGATIFVSDREVRSN